MHSHFFKCSWGHVEIEFDLSKFDEIAFVIFGSGKKYFRSAKVISE